MWDLPEQCPPPCPERIPDRWRLDEDRARAITGILDDMAEDRAAERNQLKPRGNRNEIHL